MYKGVDLHHCRTRLLFVALIIRLQRNRLAESYEHLSPGVEVVRIVVAGWQDHHVLLEVHLLGSCKRYPQVAELECAQPSLVLMAAFRIKHHGLSTHKRITRILKSLGVPAHVRQALITHSVGRKKAHCTQDLVQERIVEDICPCKEIHSPVCQLETDAEWVIETVLMVGYDYCRSAVHWHILKSKDVLLLEVEP